MSTVLLLGATGSIGRATAAELVARGHRVLCPVRGAPVLPAGAVTLSADPGRPGAVAAAIAGTRIDTVVSCLASRSGAPDEAWAIDHRATVEVARAGVAAGAGHVLLLSAICVQYPRLAFQHAKLRAEADLARLGVPLSVVRPTAFFKSLSGQLGRVQAGKPYLVFGDGRLTACKPIGDADLAAYIADRVADRAPGLFPIGGPGPALTPRDMGAALFAATGRPERVRRVPPGMLRGIAAGLGLAGRVSSRARGAAEMARIGHYYATQSMLVLDPATGRYDAATTPEYGRETFADHIARRLSGEIGDARGAHAVF
ncbi:NAD-dependent epimerase/dehydratase family protein [Palleronia sediminis]|uniref:Divinyl chlorophyllide a 8-vinyl-reductase, chloroplastic n=1 Tax=Palleronia sediminis TaxID=2547833 RepID=A0A4R6AKZ2_9RHOB|nr:NAD(P)H-binding protein [Palleronia sediminis]TDL84287.1 NAD-dependent epimerase/dehydratase family protein [Palleronia sediminis]